MTDVPMVEVNCFECNGSGTLPDHDTPENHGTDGECVSCPVPVQCDRCQASGKVQVPECKDCDGKSNDCRTCGSILIPIKSYTFICRKCGHQENISDVVETAIDEELKEQKNDFRKILEEAKKRAEEFTVQSGRNYAMLIVDDILSEFEQLS